METANQVEEETYRVIIFNRAGTEVLVVSLQRPAHPSLHSNSALAAGRGKPGRSLLKTEFGEQVICLFTPDPGPSAPHGKEIHYQVAEHWRTSQRTPIADEVWLSVSALSEDSFVDPCDYLGHTAAHSRNAMPEIQVCRSAPFARTGLVPRVAQEWAREAIEPAGLRISGKNFRQMNAGPSFSLSPIRERAARPFGSKAVGSPIRKNFRSPARLPNFSPAIFHQSWTPDGIGMVGLRRKPKEPTLMKLVTSSCGLWRRGDGQAADRINRPLSGHSGIGRS